MRIGLDIDDVVAQFFPAMCRKVGRACERINIWDGEVEAAFVRLNMRKVEGNSRFWLNLVPLSRPEDITFDFDYYVTSSPKAMIQYRIEWLRMHGFPMRPVIYSSDKLKTMHDLNLDVLIDDNPSTLTMIKEGGKIPIQFIPSYMSVEREDLNLIRHLSQVLTVLKNLK